MVLEKEEHLFSHAITVSQLAVIRFRKTDTFDLPIEQIS